MILPRQKLYAKVTPLYLAKRATQGKQGLQTAVDAEKKQLDAVIERYKSLHGGKAPSKRLVRRKLGQINDSQRFLGLNVKSGIKAGIPEQYAEQSVLGNYVGQHRVGEHESMKRTTRRWLAEKNKVDAKNNKLYKAWENQGRRLGWEPDRIPQPSFENYFVERYTAQDAAANRLKRIMKSREPYLPQKVVDQRVGQALSTKRGVESPIRHNMFGLRNASEYLSRDQAELSTANLILNPQRPPKPRLTATPMLSSIGAANQEWRYTWA